MLKKILVSLVIAVPLVFTGKYFYDKQQRSEYLETITPLVKNSSIRVSNTLKVEIDSSNITFNELFEKLDEDVKEIEKRNIEVQSAAVKKFKDISDPTIAYLGACQSYSRAMAMMYRKKLIHENSLEAAKEAVADIRGSDAYGLDYAKKRADRSIAKMEEASKERWSSAIDFHLAVKQLREKRQAASLALDDDVLVDLAKVDAVLKSSGEMAEAIKKADKEKS